MGRGGGVDRYGFFGDKVWVFGEQIVSWGFVGIMKEVRVIQVQF